MCAHTNRLINILKGTGWIPALSLFNSVSPSAANTVLVLLSSPPMLSFPLPPLLPPGAPQTHTTLMTVWNIRLQRGPLGHIPGLRTAQLLCDGVPATDGVATTLMRHLPSFWSACIVETKLSHGGIGLIRSAPRWVHDGGWSKRAAAAVAHCCGK